MCLTLNNGGSLYIPKASSLDPYLRILCLMCIVIVITTIIYLPLLRAAGYEDENIIQGRHGTDNLDLIL